MKLTSKYVVLSLLTSFQAFADEDWTVSLVQRQLTSGGSYQATVSAEGERVSLAPVPEGGSEFLLWALRQGEDGLEETLVDTELVGAYMPSGSLKITTPDTYVGTIPRTRIDQGFTLTYQVSGLLVDNNDAPLAARQALLDHNVALYEGGHSYSHLSDESDFEQLMIRRNGETQVHFDASNIPGVDVYNDAGMEFFRLYALPDGEVAQLQLSEAKVQIWPMAYAEITGVESSGAYTSIPEVRVELTNLYPDSTTWVQVYPGTQRPGTSGTMVNESTIVVDDTVPRSTALVFRELARHIQTEGDWTLEVITETPFGVERLSHRTFNLNNTIQLRGSFQTLGQ